MIFSENEEQTEKPTKTKRRDKTKQKKTRFRGFQLQENLQSPCEKLWPRMLVAGLAMIFSQK
jgi:hypothetical protein